MQNNNDQQPRLIAEPESEYTLIPEEQARKEEYREHLRQYLEDPEFRQIPGFPIGDDEAILELSDPPYYTACPNPFLTEIIEQWQKERVAIRNELGLSDDSEDIGNNYHREPFAADISESKNNPIYNAHSYHTKVPHPAIMRYILHYTDPGDIVFDGFCGTGMTGVAAQLCSDRGEVAKLGYFIDDEEWIYENPGDQQPIAKLGVRKAVLNDLSPAATFIAYNYNTPLDRKVFEREAQRILDEVEDECGWMYETRHPHCNYPNQVKAKINHIKWSIVYLCPNCGDEMLFWDVAMDQENEKIRGEWHCPICNTLLAKNPNKKSGAQKTELANTTKFNVALEKPVTQAKYVPVVINYSLGKKNYNKKPDSWDLEILQKIDIEGYKHNFPLNRIDRDIDLWYERDYRQLGIYSVDTFFKKRNLLILSNFREKLESIISTRERLYLTSVFTSIIEGSSRLNRERPKGRTGKLSGTLYVGGLVREINPIDFARRKSNHFRKLFNRITPSLVSTQSTTQISKIPDEAVDYVFTDPPFGSNIIYSDLSILWESWLNIYTNTSEEAVVHRRKKKHAFSLDQYREKMKGAFTEIFRILKYGRWITVEFHNTKNSVWNSIQEAILRSGFVVADVHTLDKKQGTFKQTSSSSAVKQDLIISAYKPYGDFELKFQTEAGTLSGVWAFIRQHLTQLPVYALSKGRLETLSERQAYLLFDRMVAFHIQRGATIPLSATQFYSGLDERFPKRDGMYFLPDQVGEYDRARLEAESVTQLKLFVSDEKTAIQWLRQQLDPELGGESQTYQDIQPKFLRQLHQAKHEVLPELSDLLEQNFLQDEQGQWYVPNPNKASDLEKIRNKSLQQEFNQYLESKKKLKQFRTEAVRAGFADAWQRKDFETIVKVAERLPETVLQEDPDLLMYYDNASLRVD